MALHCERFPFPDALGSTPHACEDQGLLKTFSSVGMREAAFILSLNDWTADWISPRHSLLGGRPRVSADSPEERRRALSIKVFTRDASASDRSSSSRALFA